MAQMIPSDVSQLSEPTGGEKLVFKAIQENTPDSWVCYANFRIVGQGRPDFCLIGPDLGLLILEVKDLSINNVKEANPEEWVVQRNGNWEKEKHPLAQANDYKIEAAKRLNRVKELRNQKGKIKLPYGHGAVLPNISRADLNSKKYLSPPLSSTFETTKVICQDELPLNQGQSTTFRERILAMNSFFKFEGISDEEVNIVQAAVFPDVRTKMFLPMYSNKKTLK